MKLEGIIDPLLLSITKILIYYKYRDKKFISIFYFKGDNMKLYVITMSYMTAYDESPSREFIGVFVDVNTGIGRAKDTYEKLKSEWNFKESFEDCLEVIETKIEDFHRPIYKI